MIAFPHQIHRTIDRIILYNMSQRIPQTLESSVEESIGFEQMLAQTSVDVGKTAVSHLTTSGEHPIWLKSGDDSIETRILVRPHKNKHAPLVIYHHGLNEYPYQSSFRRIFFNFTQPYHVVCVQAPFHNNWVDPINKGFATVNRMYQLFAGSVRLVELVQKQFAAYGASETVLVGLSWGGIVMMLHESQFHNSRAVIPMLSSPNLAQVLIDVAQLFDRDVTVQPDEIRAMLDFTRYYEECDAEKIYPLLGEQDLFFQYGKHANVYEKRPLQTIRRGHITAMWPGISLRRHVLHLLEELRKKKEKPVQKY